MLRGLDPEVLRVHREGGECSASSGIFVVLKMSNMALKKPYVVSKTSYVTL